MTLDFTNIISNARLNEKIIEIMEKALQDIAQLKTELRADVIARQTFKKIHKLRRYAAKHPI